jgi:hypothetical protein
MKVSELKTMARDRWRRTPRMQQANARGAGYRPWRTHLNVIRFAAAMPSGGCAPPLRR